MIRLAVLLAAGLAAGCNNEIYVRDGVTDGDTFYLAPRAIEDDDPALQAWVAYSLMKSACQLEVGGENPARSSSYGCEFSARTALVESWEEQRAEDETASDAYLDALLSVRRAGFLDEYTVYYFGEDDWLVPAEVDVARFRQWKRRHLGRHRPQTEIVGSWNYRQR